jgi:hypothetical protein
LKNNITINALYQTQGVQQFSASFLLDISGVVDVAEKVVILQQLE